MSILSIQAVARDGAVWGAVGSLALWGAINVGAWFLLGTENRTLLSRLTSHPTGGIYFLLYGGLILGAVMFAFAAMGFTTRTSATIFLDGLSLLTVGIWNIIHDFVVSGVIRPYGYTIEKPSTLWIMLGACQVVWGVRQFATFGRIVSWSPAHLASAELQQVKKLLQQFVSTAEQTGDGIVKASITTQGPLGLDFMARTAQYTGRLLDDFALMVSANLDDCFTISRIAANDLSFSDTGSMTVTIEGSTKNLALGPLSVDLFKNWYSQSNAERLPSTVIEDPQTLQRMEHSKEELARLNYPSNMSICHLCGDLYKISYFRWQNKDTCPKCCGVNI